MPKQKKAKPRERKNLPLKTRILVLTEAGYRCAVPNCRTILTLNIHHIWEVTFGGGDDPENLIALCPNCHTMYHQGFIHPDSIYLYKSMLVAISRAFDLEAVDRLLFLRQCENDFLIVSGDGLLHFARLISAGFAVGEQKANNNWLIVTYTVNITNRGKQLIDAWRSGDQTQLKLALGGPLPRANPSGPSAKPRRLQPK